MLTRLIFMNPFHVGLAAISLPLLIRGASPPRSPHAVARGAPNAPLRSGGRVRGAPRSRLWLHGAEQIIGQKRLRAQGCSTKQNCALLRGRYGRATGTATL